MRLARTSMWWVGRSLAQRQRTGGWCSTRRSSTDAALPEAAWRGGKEGRNEPQQAAGQQPDEHPPEPTLRGGYGAGDERQRHEDRPGDQTERRRNDEVRRGPEHIAQRNGLLIGASG